MFASLKQIIVENSIEKNAVINAVSWNREAAIKQKNSIETKAPVNAKKENIHIPQKYFYFIIKEKTSNVK